MLYHNHQSIPVEEKTLKPSAVHEWAEQKNLKVFTPNEASDKIFMEKISKNKIDLNIIVSYGKILNEKLLNLPNFFSINVHASLLPRWRGAAPIHRAILSNDKKTGVCIMKVNEKLDAGPIILSKKLELMNQIILNQFMIKLFIMVKFFLKRL